jgi:hypothetical protein
MALIRAFLLGVILAACGGTSFAAAQEQPSVASSDLVQVCDLGWGPETVVGTGEKADPDLYRVPDRFRRPGTDRNGTAARGTGQLYKLRGRPLECPTRQLPLVRFTDGVSSHFRFMSGIRHEQSVAIRSRRSWRAQWHRVSGRRRDPVPTPSIDFEREMVLMVAMGPRRSGGYSVTIEKVLERPTDVQAIVRYMLPGPRCGAIAAITSPVDIVRVPASTKPVNWVVLRQATQCS